MPDETSSAASPHPVPEVGALVVDRGGKVTEFRGVWCGQWSVRPVTGGTERIVAPGSVTPASPEEEMRAKVARANARTAQRQTVQQGTGTA